jgi:hypothetical protein
MLWVGVGVTLTILNNNFFKLKQTSKHNTLYRNNLFLAVIKLTPTPPLIPVLTHRIVSNTPDGGGMAGGVGRLNG